MPDQIDVGFFSGGSRAVQGTFPLSGSARTHWERRATESLFFITKEEENTKQKCPIKEAITATYVLDFKFMCLNVYSQGISVAFMRTPWPYFQKIIGHKSGKRHVVYPRPSLAYCALQWKSVVRLTQHTVNEFWPASIIALLPCNLSLAVCFPLQRAGTRPLCQVY